MNATPHFQSNTGRFAGKRCLVMGLGRHGGGVAVTRWLAERGAMVTVTDLASAETLEPAIEALSAVPIAHFRLGRHEESDFSNCDYLIVNPAVKPGNPLVELARRSGAHVTSEIELLLQACPARMIGVTGSNGKSTTVSMLAAMLRCQGYKTWLGGNIGVSLLPDLANMQPSDWAVLELSSFQLAHLNAEVRMPELALIINCTANHLDWHGGYEHYAWSKRRLLQTELHAKRIAVLNQKDPELARWAEHTPCEIWEPWPDCELPPLKIPGEHNRLNARCAAAAAAAAGCSRGAICTALSEFTGLPHRLQAAGLVFGRTFYNDSKSTTPEAATAALLTLDEPVWLLAGGFDKGLDFGPLADVIIQRARGAALFGQARHKLAAAIESRDSAFRLHVEEHLEPALRWCCERSAAGDAILLSPACSSHDQFAGFEQRGAAFLELISKLESQSFASPTP